MGRYHTISAGWVAALLLGVSSARAVTQYNGALNNPAVDPAFAVATAAHFKQFIDFDDDGYVFIPNVPTPILPYQYLSQGVILENLDAKYVGNQPWTHSPPWGAWHSGFDSPITTPYSFIFTNPVASFGMFSNDVEATINVTVVNGTTQNFTIPFQGGADVTQFHGFVAPGNLIQRIDFTSLDYHNIDDVQFGYVYVPEPTGIVAFLPLLTVVLARRGRLELR
jgi:hypothetical protein